MSQTPTGGARVRRNFGVALSLMPILALAACSSSAAAVGGATSSTSGSTQGKSVVYIQGMSGIPFYSSVSCGAQTEAKAEGVDFSSQGPDTWDVTKQTAIVNAVVAKHPDAIMISVTDTKAMQAPLLQAKAAGIPIIGIDDTLDDTSIMSSYIQSDSIEGGKLAAKQLATAMGGKGKVIAINNVAGTPIGDARVKGFTEGLKDYPGITYLGVQYSNNDTSKAANIASTTASSDQGLTGIFTVTTNNTEGAITGLREAGKTGAVKLVGYDTSDPIVEALKAGNVDGLVVQYPYGEGVQGIKTAAEIWAGKTVEYHQTSPFVIATKDNVDSAEVSQYLYKTKCA